MNKSISVIILICAILLSGCVTGTRNINLTKPDFENDKSSEGLVYIGEVHDRRQFEAEPRDPSTPSVNGELSEITAEQRSTLIGRQRSGFGKALGDVSLPDQGTVQQQVRALLAEGLESRGYQVTDDPNAPIRLDVEIDKLWGWFTPGFWAVSFEAELLCALDFSTADNTQQFDIAGYGKNRGQVASNGNWMLAFERAYVDFLKNMDQKMDAAGL